MKAVSHISDLLLLLLLRSYHEEIESNEHNNNYKDRAEAFNAALTSAQYCHYFKSPSNIFYNYVYYITSYSNLQEYIVNILFIIEFVDLNWQKY